MKKAYTRRRIWLLAAALTLLCSITLTACGSGDMNTAAESMAYTDEAAYDYDADYTADGLYDEPAPAGAEDAYEGDYGEGYTDGASPTQTPPEDDRYVIMYASLTVQTLEFDATLENLQLAIKGAGAYISQSDVDYGTEGRRSASFTVRVPAARYAAFLQDAEHVGSMVSRNEYSEDVTSAIVDIDARLTSLYAQEERLMALMQEAKDLDTLLMLEGELTQVQYEIEYYLGMRRTYTDLVSYSTVDIFIYEVEEIVPVEEEPDPTYGSRVSDAFIDSWTATGRFFQDLSVVLIAGLPVILFLLLAGFIALVLVRRYMKKHPKQERPAQPLPLYMQAQQAPPRPVAPPQPAPPLVKPAQATTAPISKPDKVTEQPKAKDQAEDKPQPGGK